MTDHTTFMKRAIELSRKAALVDKTGGAFGCVIVKDGKIVGEGYNQVVKTSDPTWHAEMHAIREASKTLGTPHLEGCDLYTSAECCPMCLAAAYWAHIRHIYYAATVHDALTYGKFQDIDFHEEIRKEPEERQIKSKQIMQDEAVVVWQEYAELSDRVHY